MLEDTVALPLLRNELRIEEATLTKEGRKRWRLYDPITHRFFLLEEADVSLLTLWKSGTVGALRAAFQRMNLVFDEGQLEQLLSFLMRHELLRNQSDNQALERLQEKYLASYNTKGWKRNLDKLRSFRKPLVYVEPILSQLDPITRLLGRRFFAFCWLFITLIGVYFSVRQWDDFIHTANGLFNLKGMIAFGITLFVIKCFHELGHAYLARYYGCKVGRIGLATFLFFPMLYTELDDVSRLNSARQKMLIAAGGVLTEIVIAGLATFLWALLSDGLLRSLAFMVATTCWTTSILINLNPFAKFDGYYILSDFLKVENLQSKGLAWGNWFLDRLVMGKNSPVPDNAAFLAATGFTLFGIGTWLYQVILLTSVSYFLYVFLLPIVGITLFTAVVMTYVVSPIVKRFIGWWQDRHLLTMARRLTLCFLLLGLVAVLFLPIDRSVHLASIMRNQQLAVIRAPENAQVKEWNVAPNQLVYEGQLIVSFVSPELNQKIRTAEIAFKLAQERLSSVAANNKQRALTLILSQELEQERTSLAGLMEQAELLEWRSPANGRLVDVPLQLAPGQWVSPSQPLGRIVDTRYQEGLAFVPERYLQRIELGAKVNFYPDDPSWPVNDAQITAIESSAIEYLMIDELNQAYGGSITTEKDEEGREVPAVALHQVRFMSYTRRPVSAMQLSGDVIIEATAESIASQVWSNLWGLLLTELRR